MDKALWNGKVITISEVIDDRELEPIIVKASKNHQLQCIDPHCDTKDLEYCHGNIYTAYFRHAKAGNCDYAKYSSEENPQVRKVRRALQQHFSSLYETLSEEKLIEHHFTPIIINADNCKIAIEINANNDPDDIERLIFQYNKIDMPVTFVNIGKVPYISNERYLSKSRRFYIHNSKYNDVIAIDPEDLAVRQYRLDNNKYFFANINIFQSDILTIKDLIIRDGTICLRYFDEQYQNWIKDKLKKDEYEKRQYDEKEKIRIREEAKRKEENERRLREIANQKKPEPISSTQNHVQEPTHTQEHNYTQSIDYSRISPNAPLNDKEFYCHHCKKVLPMEMAVGIILPKTEDIVHGICRICINSDDKF